MCRYVEHTSASSTLLTPSCRTFFHVYDRFQMSSRYQLSPHQPRMDFLTGARYDIFFVSALVEPYRTIVVDRNFLGVHGDGAPSGRRRLFPRSILAHNSLCNANHRIASRKARARDRSIIIVCVAYINDNNADNYFVLDSGKYNNAAGGVRYAYSVCISDPGFPAKYHRPNIIFVQVPVHSAAYMRFFSLPLFTVYVRVYIKRRL